MKTLKNTLYKIRINIVFFFVKPLYISVYGYALFTRFHIWVRPFCGVLGLVMPLSGGFNVVTPYSSVSSMVTPFFQSSTNAYAASAVFWVWLRPFPVFRAWLRPFSGNMGGGGNGKGERREKKKEKKEEQEKEDEEEAVE